MQPWTATRRGWTLAVKPKIKTFGRQVIGYFFVAQPKAGDSRHNSLWDGPAHTTAEDAQRAAEAYADSHPATPTQATPARPAEPTDA